MPFRSTGVALLRSISSTTGALIGGLGAGGPVLAATAAEMVFGRPSSTAVVAVPFAIGFGLVGALVGAVNRLAVVGESA